MLKFFPLKILNIDLFSRKDVLFISDFRAVGESFEYDIPAMWKYENLLVNIVGGDTLCNEYYPECKLLRNNTPIVVTCGANSKISIVKRFQIQNKKPLQNKSFIYAPIAHPDIDEYSRQLGIPVSYKYEDFLIYNNKILQKKACNNITPSWKEINHNSSNIFNSNKSFIKRALGSGGYCIWDARDDINFLTEHSYYMESFVEGKSMSVQIYTENGQHTMFGYAEQLLENNKEFIGAKIFKISDMDEIITSFLYEVVKCLTAELLKDYTGFWGVDFIYDTKNKKCSFLEANVRMTALTVPTLIKNTYYSSNNVVFREDCDNKNNDDLIITYDAHDKLYDILTLLDE